MVFRGKNGIDHVTNHCISVLVIIVDSLFYFFFLGSVRLAKLIDNGARITNSGVGL